MYTYKHCTWRSATAVKTLVQECCEKSVLFFFLLISFICTSIRISFDFLIYIYIRLKIKPSSVSFLSCQIFVLPSTGFELTALIHYITNRLAICPGHIRYIKNSFNSPSVTLSRKENLEREIRHVSKPV